MQNALGLYCEVNGHVMRKTYVWLGTFSIPHFHGDCKLLAVNSGYVYATAADGIVIFAPVFLSLIINIQF